MTFITKIKLSTSIFLFGLVIAYPQLQLGSSIHGITERSHLGRCVSLSSDGLTIAAGANTYINDLGYAVVYKYIESNWVQVGSPLFGQDSGDAFGSSISLSSDGTIMAIGARNKDGFVQVYKLVNTEWVQMGNTIFGENSFDYFGESISLSSDGLTLVSGATGNNGGNGTNGGSYGHVRVYKFDGSQWVQMGSDIDGEASGDHFGRSVSISSDGTILAIGAFLNDGNGMNSGHVRVFKYSDTNWVQIGSDIDGESEGDQSGQSVSISSDGTIVAIGAYRNSDNGFNSGQVRVYKQINNEWNQLGNDIEGEFQEDESGCSVSLSSDGTKLVIGAYLNDGTNGYNSGHARVFKYIDTTWVQLGHDIDGEVAFDFSGYSVSMSSDGNKVAMGAIYNDENGYESGQVRIFDVENEVLSIPNYFLDKIRLFPNPASNLLKLNISNTIELNYMRLYNSLGMEVRSSNNSEMDISGLKSGVYIVEIMTNKGKKIDKIMIL